MFTNKTHEKAHEALKNEEIDLSIELYTKALEQNPNDCNILSDRGVAYLHAGNKELCFKDLNRAIELQPDYSFRYACRAFAKNNFGDLDGAILDYEKAVQLDKDDAVAHNNLGLLLEQKGYQKEAEERFKRADQLSKQEDGLLEVIDSLESKPNEESHERPTIESKKDEPVEPKEKTTGAKEFKKVFTSMKQFEEFMDFIKNGFKIK